MQRKNNLKTWKKIGGGTFTLSNGIIILPNEVFKAADSDIPQAFRDVIVLIDEEEELVIEEEQMNEVPIPVLSNPIGNPKRNVEAIQRANSNWWDIFIDGKKLNEKALNKKDALALVQTLQED